MGKLGDIEYVIFDMDGLLIDSERIYTLATNKILEPYGLEMTWEIKKGCMGVPELAAAQHLLSSFPPESLNPGNGLPELTLDLYLNRRNILQDSLWPTVPLLPGAARLVRHLIKHKIPIAVATGSRRSKYYIKTQTGPEHSSAGAADNAADVLEKRQLFQLFGDKIVCADDDRPIPREDGAARKMQGKPHPDVFLVAAEQVLGRQVGFEEEKVTPQQVSERAKGLVFEDAVLGVLAGMRAGMKVVWVPDPNLLELEKENMEVIPHKTITSLVDFVPEEWGLPSYDEE